MYIIIKFPIFHVRVILFPVPVLEKLKLLVLDIKSNCVPSSEGACHLPSFATKTKLFATEPGSLKTMAVAAFFGLFMINAFVVACLTDGKSNVAFSWPVVMYIQIANNLTELQICSYSFGA